MAERCASSTNSLVVLTGRHAGASVGLRDGSAVIGGGDAATVFLTDPSVRDIAVRVESNPSGQMIASCLSGECSVGRSELLPNAKPKRIRPGQVLRIGDVSLRYGAASPNKAFMDDRSVAARSRVSLAAAAVLALGVSGFIGMTGGFATTDGAVEAVAKAPETVDSPPLSALADLRVMLSEASLSGVRVSLDQGGSYLVATGVLPESDQPVWQRVTEWYDAKYGASVMLEADVEFAEGGVVLPFDIQAVLTHPRSRIVLHDGSDHGVGAVLPGGWTLESIDASAIRISRNEDVITVRF